MVECVVDELGDIGGVEVVPAVFVVFGYKDGDRSCGWCIEAKVRCVCGREISVLVELYKGGCFVLVSADSAVCCEDGDDL